MHSESYIPPPPKHDILDVSAYLESGLVASTIDRWFLGAVPHFPLKPGFGVPMKDLPVREESFTAQMTKGKEVAKEDVQLAAEDAEEISGKKTCLDEALKKARRKLAEGMLDDARREQNQPLVLPAMMDAFQKIAQLTGNALMDAEE